MFSNLSSEISTETVGEVSSYLNVFKLSSYSNISNSLVASLVVVSEIDEVSKTEERWCLDSKNIVDSAICRVN